MVMEEAVVTEVTAVVAMAAVVTEVAAGAAGMAAAMAEVAAVARVAMVVVVRLVAGGTGPQSTLGIDACSARVGLCWLRPPRSPPGSSANSQEVQIGKAQSCGSPM